MDSWMGRIAEPATLHKYMYTHSDPVNGIDPSGHMNMLSVSVGIAGGAILLSSALPMYQLGQDLASNNFDPFDSVNTNFKSMGFIVLMTMVGPRSPLFNLIGVDAPESAVPGSEVDTQDYGPEACTLMSVSPSSYPGYSEVRYACRQFPGWPIVRYIPTVVVTMAPQKAPCAPGFPWDMMPLSLQSGLNGGAWRECHFRY